MPRRSLLAFAILVMLPAAASAGSFTYYGPQLGFSQGPDQFVVGGHLQWNTIAPRLDFAPGIDLGFGSDQTVVSLNGDFHYRIATNTTWQPYIGGGIGLHFTSGSNSVAGSGDSQAGGHFIAGATVPLQGRSRFFTELKLGFGNGPDLKMLAGWNYRSR
jgi:hypothetical protein